MPIKEERENALAQMVDELGDLEAETQPWRVKIARADALRAALRAQFKNLDSTRTYSREGERWRVLVGAAGSQSIVDRAKLLKLVGPTKFASAATISLKALIEVCGLQVSGAVVSTTATGPRPLTVVPIEREDA